MKKKSLLLAVGAMGLVAAGTAGVSTVAWYQASAVPTVSSSVYTSSAIGTATTSMPMGDVEIQFSIAAINNVQLTNLVGTTLHKGQVVGGQVDAQGNVTDGEVVTEALDSSTDTMSQFVVEYVVTATFKTATDAQKAALAGKSVTATLTAEGYAKLRANASETGADEASHTLTVSFDGTDTISVTGEKYVRIQAKETGKTKVDLVAHHADDKLTIAALNEATAS